MSDADCTPGREPRSVATSISLYLHITLMVVCLHLACFILRMYTITVCTTMSVGGTADCRGWCHATCFSICCLVINVYLSVKLPRNISSVYEIL